jgi:hypothetical protein
MCDGGQKVQLLEMYLVDTYRMKNGNLGGYLMTQNIFP